MGEVGSDQGKRHGVVVMSRNCEGRRMQRRKRAGKKSLEDGGLGMHKVNERRVCCGDGRKEFRFCSLVEMKVLLEMSTADDYSHCACH